MVDLLSSLPDPPPEFEAAHSPPTSCRGLWAVAPQPPDLVSWSVGRMPAVAAGMAPRVEVAVHPA